MGNINHNRPQLRFTDNIRRVLLHEQQDNSFKADKPVRPPKKEVDFGFQEGEEELCLSFLDATEAYFKAFSEFTQTILGPGSTKTKKILSDKAEAYLRAKIRELINRMLAAAIAKKESGLMAFCKYFQKSAGKGAMIIDIMADEMSMMEKKIGA